MAFILCASVSTFSIIPVFAHDARLEVGYDDCVALNNQDGIDETWYVLNKDSTCNHFPHTNNTIKYYFANESMDGTYTWTTDVSEATANEIKEAYANSMKKWNNVFFYSYDNVTGNIVKNKLINVVAGTEDDHNLTIYPQGNSTKYFAETSVSGENSPSNGGDHYHWGAWKMIVYVNYFYVHDNLGSNYVAKVKEWTGAHEFGHVLGLRDVDLLCSAYEDADDYHHQEVLMGYGGPMSARSSDITYKDIAGVAITRGFHTDDDHMWLNAGVQSDGTYKLICSICNGVKYVGSLSGYTYNTFGACNNSHTLSSGNMMAVASYGNKDYYKCKYCRYVAPFGNIVEQNYSAIPVTGGTQHRVTNNVSGLSYSFLEDHSWIGGECRECGFTHPHTYTYADKNRTYHTKSCECGYVALETHFIRSSDIVDGRYASCLGCGRMVDLNFDNAIVQPFNIAKVSVNGSYILSNGIVVLVDDDIDAYLNGTLQFYDRDDVPVTE